MLGHTGTVFEPFARYLKPFRLPAQDVRTLMHDLHDHAVRTAHAIVTLRRRLEHSAYNNDRSPPERKKETVTHNRRGLSGRPAPIKGAAALKRSTGHLRAARTESNQVHAAGSTPACQSHSLGACSCNMHHNCRQTGNMHAHTSDHAALPRTPPLRWRGRHAQP